MHFLSGNLVGDLVISFQLCSLEDVRRQICLQLVLEICDGGLKKVLKKSAIFVCKTFMNHVVCVLQQQLSAYMAWVNSQLKKKPGTHIVEDLRNDMRDGVVFADVIEIVCKYWCEKFFFLSSLMVY
jgi:hypothetical protein